MFTKQTSNHERITGIGFVLTYKQLENSYILCFFLVSLQPFKNVKSILSSRAVAQICSWDQSNDSSHRIKAMLTRSIIKLKNKLQKQAKGDPKVN